MLKLNQVVQHLSQQPGQPARQSEPAEETLLNYLGALRNIEDTLKPELLQQFIFEALDYPYWQQKRGLLTKTLKGIVDQLEAAEPYSTIRWPDEIQVFEVERLNDQIDLVSSYLKLQIPNDAKSRVIFDPLTKKILSISLLASGELIIHQFGPRFFLSQGQLVPLRTDLKLLFGKDLELSPNHMQKLEIAPFLTASFILKGRVVSGSAVYGYSMKKQQEFKGEALAQTGRLLYAIRRCEQFFLKKESNPLYLELTLGLERMVNMVKLADPEALQKAQSLILHAKNCLEHVFVGDKFLSLLLRELQQALPSDQACKNSSDLTN